MVFKKVDKGARNSKLNIDIKLNDFVVIPFINKDDIGAVILLDKKGEITNLTIAAYDKSKDVSVDSCADSIFSERKIISYTVNSKDIDLEMNNLYSSLKLAFISNTSGIIFDEAVAIEEIKKNNPSNLWTENLDTHYELKSVMSNKRDSIINVLVNDKVSPPTISLGYGTISQKGRQNSIFLEIQLNAEGSIAIREAKEKIEKYFMKSHNHNNFMVRVEAQGKSPDGVCLDDELKSDFKTKVVREPNIGRVKNSANNPRFSDGLKEKMGVIHGLLALKDLGEIEFISESKDSRGQSKFGLKSTSGSNSKRITMTFVNKDSYDNQSYSISPQRWIVPSSRKSGASVWAAVKHLIDEGVVGDAQNAPEDDRKSLASAKMREIYSYLRESKVNLHELDDETLSSKMIIRPRLLMPIGDNSLVYDVFRDRGISDSLIASMINKGLAYSSIDSFDNPCVVTNLMSSGKVSAQQLFTVHKNKDGSLRRVGKIFTSGAKAQGSVFQIGAEDSGLKNPTKSIVAEATIDALSYLEILKIKGEDVSGVKSYSMMSAGNVNAFLTDNYGLSMPENVIEKSQSSIGFFVENKFTRITREQVDSKLERLFKGKERIIFVDDGSSESKLNKEIYFEMLRSSKMESKAEVVLLVDSMGIKEKEDVVIFNNTNINETLHSDYLYYNEENGEIRGADCEVVRTPIVTNEDKVRAKELYDQGGGAKEIVFAYDNDTAGLEYYEPFYNLMSGIGVNVSLTPVPYFNKDDLRFESMDVKKEIIKNQKTPELSKFSYANTGNDINDLLASLHATTDQDVRDVALKEFLSGLDTSSSEVVAKQLEEMSPIAETLRLRKDIDNERKKLLSEKIGIIKEQMKEVYSAAYNAPKGSNEREQLFEQAKELKKEIDLSVNPRRKPT